MTSGKQPVRTFTCIYCGEKLYGTQKTVSIQVINLLIKIKLNQ